MKHKFWGIALSIALAACAPLKSAPDAVQAAAPNFRYAAVWVVQGVAKTSPIPELTGSFRLADYTFAITQRPAGADETHVTLADNGINGRIAVSKNAVETDSGEYTITATNSSKTLGAKTLGAKTLGAKTLGAKTLGVKAEIAVHQIISYPHDDEKFVSGKLKDGKLPRNITLLSAMMPSLKLGDKDLLVARVSEYRWTIAGPGVVANTGLPAPGKMNINADTGLISGDGSSTPFPLGDYTVTATAKPAAKTFAKANSPLEFTFTIVP